MLNRFQVVNLLYKISFFETYDNDTVLDNNFEWGGSRSCHDKKSDSQVTLRKYKAKLIHFHFLRLSSEQLHQMC